MKEDAILFPSGYLKILSLNPTSQTLNPKPRMEFGQTSLAGALRRGGDRGRCVAYTHAVFGF